MGVNTNPTFSPPLGSHNQYTNSQVLLQKQTPFSWCQGPYREQTIDLPIQPHHAECIAIDRWQCNQCMCGLFYHCSIIRGPVELWILFEVFPVCRSLHFSIHSNLLTFQGTRLKCLYSVFIKLQSISCLWHKPLFCLWVIKSSRFKQNTIQKQTHKV